MVKQNSSSRPEAWRSLLQRGVDTAAEVSDVLAQKLNAIADPRAKQLRKRKVALWLGLFFTGSCALLIGVTTLLATWHTPAWALFIPAPLAVGAAFLADVGVSALPVASRRTAAAAAVPRHSAAATMGVGGSSAAGRAGRFRARAVLADQRDGARQDAACGRASRIGRRRQSVRGHDGRDRQRSGLDERAVANAPQSRNHLAPTIAAFTTQLDSGARQYNDMVTAAAQLVSAANTGPMPSSPMSAQRYRDELVNATDRLTGWAQAFDELGQLRRA